jgi:hypothetical protein
MLVHKLFGPATQVVREWERDAEMANESLEREWEE